MSPALSGSSVIWRFERSDAIEIHNVIIFDFYTGHFWNCTYMQAVKHDIVYNLINTNLLPSVLVHPALRLTQVDPVVACRMYEN